MADIKKNEKYRKKEKPDTEILTLGRMPPQNVEAEMAVFPMDGLAATMTRLPF